MVRSLSGVKTLRCLGLALVSGFLSSSLDADPMSFQFLDRCQDETRGCNVRVLAIGDIEVESAAALKEFVSRHLHSLHKRKRSGLQICFDSLGGDLEGALALGEVIHGLKLDTCMEPQYFPVYSSHDIKHSEATERMSAQPICASACVFALAAGVHRSI